MKTLSGITADRLALLQPEGIRAYLHQRGWQQVDFPDDRVWVFAAPDDRHYTVPVPATRRLSDYAALVDRVLVALTDADECTFEDLFHLLDNREILKMRALDQSATSRATLPLPAADMLIKKARELLTYSACSEVAAPRAHYAKPVRRAKAHADSYELGQTQPGSFVISIITPAAPVDAPDATRLADIDALETRVVRRIVTGVEIVVDAVRSQDEGVIVENYRRGLNANMCDILADTIEHTGLDELAFSAQGTGPHGTARQLSVSITRASIPQLDAASVRLKAVPVDELAIVTGPVTMLRNEDTGSTDWQRHIQVAWPQKGIHVHVILSQEDYAVACDAHRDRQPITVEGVLHHEKRKFHLVDYRRFRVAGSEQGAFL